MSIKCELCEQQTCDRCEVCQTHNQQETAMPVCQNCETTGDGADSWGGLCHDCDNQLDNQFIEQD
jgi:hypothetical protein